MKLCKKDYDFPVRYASSFCDIEEVSVGQCLFQSGDSFLFVYGKNQFSGNYKHKLFKETNCNCEPT